MTSLYKSLSRPYQTPCTCVAGLALTGQLLGTSSTNPLGNGGGDADQNIDFDA